MGNLANNEIAVNELVLARNCLYAVLAPDEAKRRGKQARSGEVTRNTILGDAAHKFMQGKSADSVSRSLQRELSNLLKEGQTSVIAEAQELAAVKRSMMEVGEEVQVEHQRSIVEVGTGWTIFSKPDRVEKFTDNKGDYIQVLDFKLDGRVRDRHKDTIRLFGLVEYIINEGEMRIKLVVESFSNPNSNYVEWIETPHDAVLLLRDVQDTLARIEDAQSSTKALKRTTGEHCYACCMRATCKQGVRFLAQEKEKRQQSPMYRRPAVHAPSQLPIMQ